LGGIIKSDNDKFKVGLNYISADRRIGRETDGRLLLQFHPESMKGLRLMESWGSFFEELMNQPLWVMSNFNTELMQMER
jgi:hypothetical protein